MELKTIKVDPIVHLILLNMKIRDRISIGKIVERLVKEEFEISENYDDEAFYKQLKYMESLK